MRALKKQKFTVRRFKSNADRIVEEARKTHRGVDMQIEHVRWLRDVTYRDNFKMQFSCATAIDKLKGLY